MKLNPELQTSPDCLAIERLDGPFTEAEEAHLRGCPRCEAELSLWRSFDASNPAADEGGAVAWITSELRRRRAAESGGTSQTADRGWLATFGWRPFAALAMLVLAAGIGYVAWDPAPVVGTPPDGAQTYRESAVRAIAPVGELPAPPVELSWEAVAGAVSYNVQVLEIDRTPLWNISTRSTRVGLPPAATSRIVPGKTLLWSVTAIDGLGRAIAESAMQSFRVVVDKSPGSR